MIKKALENSRFAVFIAVAGSLTATLTLLVFGIYEIGVVLVKIPQGVADFKLINEFREFDWEVV
jgi:hypothetical protein